MHFSPFFWKKIYPLPQFLQIGDEELIPLTRRSESTFRSEAIIEDGIDTHCKIFKRRSPNVLLIYRGRVLMIQNNSDRTDPVLHCKKVGVSPKTVHSNVLEPLKSMPMEEVKYFHTAPSNDMNFTEAWVSALCNPVSYELNPYA